uniref:hypothetical protein n=1 Tax=Halococcus sediminicola TaxID=1264579 RepID=UPI000B0DA464|nr:hypothetical protein [Halococcus sediminicola]
MGYLTALAKTDLLDDLNYTDRNVVGKLSRPIPCVSADFTRLGMTVSQAPNGG